MDYLIASTPRVGSNLLASLLMALGELGEPREYLCPTEFGEFGPRIQNDPSEFSAYYKSCRERFSKGGNFGVKVHYAQLQWAAQHGFDLQEFFPERVVYLTRSDTLGQAISYVRALQTGAWISEKEERAKPQFEPGRIHSAVRRIVDENHAWEAFFRRHDIEPYRVGYETLCEDFGAELQRMLPFLGVDPGSVNIHGVVDGCLGYFKKQRDELNEEWRSRYTEWLRVQAASKASRRRHMTPKAS